MEKKRKTRTSTAVKDRYNKKVYTAVTVKLPKDLVAEFREKCAECGDSQAQIFKKAMEEYLAQ